MKYVLAIFCGAIVLFMGGCAVLTARAMPLPLLPAAIAILNILILGALFGWKTQWRPAFYILGVIDLLIAVFAGVAAFSMGGSDQSVVVAGGLAIGAKGVLSIIYGRSTAREG